MSREGERGRGESERERESCQEPVSQRTLFPPRTHIWGAGGGGGGGRNGITCGCFRVSGVQGEGIQTTLGGNLGCAGQSRLVVKGFGEHVPTERRSARGRRGGLR